MYLQYIYIYVCIYAIVFVLFVLFFLTVDISKLSGICCSLVQVYRQFCIEACIYNVYNILYTT